MPTPSTHPPDGDAEIHQNLPSAAGSPTNTPPPTAPDDPKTMDRFQQEEGEHELRLSHSRLQGILNSQIDMVCRYTPDGILTYVNDAYCRFFGESRESLVGSSFLRLVTDDQRPQILARLEALRHDPASGVSVVTGQDGSGQQYWIQWVDCGITDKNGRVVELQAVGRDITDLIWSQRRLADREEMLASIVRSIPILIVQFSPDQEIEFVNQYFTDLLGWTLDDLRAHPEIQSTLFPLAHWDFDALKERPVSEIGWVEIETRTRGGAPVFISATVVPMSDGRLLGIAKDVTQNRQLEEHRQRSERLERDLQREREVYHMRDRLISMISHEFRAPLTAINTYASTVLSYLDRLPPEKINEKLNGIVGQVQRMTDLLEDILRLKEGQALNFNPEDIPLPAFCQRIADTLVMVDAGRHPLTIEVEEGRLHADPRLLEHMLTNLLSNAFKYSPPYSSVTLSARRVENTWQIAVSDSGIGIPEDELPHLFDLFYRASNAHAYPGTGLGLSIVKDYAERHGGSIAVRSVLGAGTTFTLTLPEAA